MTDLFVEAMRTRGYARGFYAAELTSSRPGFRKKALAHCDHEHRTWGGAMKCAKKMQRAFPKQMSRVAEIVLIASFPKGPPRKTTGRTTV